MASNESDVTVNLRIKAGSSAAEVLKVAKEMGVLSGAIDGVEKSARRGSPSVTDLTRGVLQGNLAFFTLRGALTQVRRGFSDFVSAVEGAVKAASQQQAALAQLDQILRNTGETTSGLREEIVDLSNKYQALTGVGDEVIQGFQGQLVAFGATTENIGRLTKATLDLSAAMGKDLNSAALLIGKALQGQFTTLSRFGIVVDENATKAQKLEQALTIIEKRFGGSAAAQVQNYTGQMKVLGAQLGEVQEAFGNTIVENVNFLNALKAGVAQTISFAGTIDGMNEALSKVTTGALKVFADNLPVLLQGLVRFILGMLDLTKVFVAFGQTAGSLVVLFGGLRKTLELAVIALAGYRVIAIGVAAANVALATSTLAVDTAVTKTPWGAFAKGVLLLGVVALSTTGVLDKLAARFTKATDNGTDVQKVLDDVKASLKALEDPLLQVAAGFKTAVDASVDLNGKFATKVSELQQAKQELNALATSQLEGTQESFAGLAQQEQAQALIDKMQLVNFWLLAISNDAVKAGVSLSSAFIKAAEAAGSTVDFGQVGPPAPGGSRVLPGLTGKDPKADAIKNIREEIEATRLENQIRQEGIDIGRLVAETDALVSAGKLGLKADSEALAKQLADEKVKQIDIIRVQTDLKKVQDALYDTPRAIENLEGQIKALDGLNASTVTELSLKQAQVRAQAEIDVKRAKITDSLTKEKIVTDEVTRATVEFTAALKDNAAQEDARINKALPLKQQEIELLTLVKDGTLSLEEAEIRLAKAQAQANGQSGENVELLARQELAITKLRKRIEDTTIDLRKSFDNIVDGLVDGILQGTNKSLDIMEIFKRSGQAIFGDMLKGMLKDKLGFDGKFSANFLNELPKIVAGGADIIGGIWGALMGSMSGGGGGSGFSQILGGIGSVAGAFGVTGGSSVAGLAQLGTAAAGGNAGGGLLSNTSTMVTLLRGLYSGVTTFTGGGSIGASLNAAFGGFLTPVLNGINAIAPSIGSFLGVGNAATTGVAAFSPVSATSSVTIGAVEGLTPAVSQLANIISVAAPYLAMIGGIIATNTGVANLLNSDVYSRAFTLKDRRQTADAGWMDNFVQNAIAQATTLGVVQSGKDQLSAAQNTFAGKGSAGDIVQTILQVFTNLPQLIVAAFATSLPTGGTATRAAFEDWIEDARKHQSRAFNPFFGSVPVIDPATKQFVVASGEYDRNLGQEKIRDRLTERYGSDKDTPDGAFVEVLRELIYEEGRLLGLTEANTKAVIGLSAAFKSVTLGDSKGGSDIQRYLANGLELVANLRASGASAALSMQFLRFEIARLGDPAKVFNELNDSLKSGHLDAQTYREAIEGLASVYFKLSAEGELEFDLSEKNGKGLAVAQETLDAIKGIIQDVLPGVRFASVAVQVLNKHIDELGQQGPVTFQELKDAIDAASASATQINPEILAFFTRISAGASQAIKDGTQEALIDSSMNQFIATLGRQIQEGVSTAIVDGFLNAQIDTGILGPLNTRIADAGDTFLGSARAPDDLQAYITEIRSAGLEAINLIRALGPAMRELAAIALDVGKAFDDALLAQVAEDAVGLALAINALSEAQKAFNNEIDARIYALRNEGAQDPEIIRRGLPDIEKEFKLTLLGYFGTLSDVIKAQNEGLITATEAPTFLSRLPGQANAPTLSQKFDALGQLRALAEADLAIRIAGYQAVGAAEIKRHQEAIDGLQEERDALQEYYATAIQLRQDELEIIQEQIQSAEKWKQVLDTVSEAIFSLQTGQQSPFSPAARLSIAEEEFRKQQALFADTSLSADERARAGQKLADLGPQLLELLQSTGASQSSERFAAFFDFVIQQLRDVAAYSKDKISDITGGKTIEELQAEGNILQKEIKDLQREQRDKLEDIDNQIKAEQAAIVAVQERVREQVAAASAGTANILEWIQGQGNEIFKQQTEQLKQKLTDLGVDSASLFDVQTNSWMELINIRRILEGEGITVTDKKPLSTTPGSGAGMFGQSEAGNEQLKTTLSATQPGGVTASTLQSLFGATREELTTLQREGGFTGALIESIYSVFPDTRNSLPNFTTVIDAMLKKINDPTTYQPVLGFASGGIINRPTYGLIGESGPEAVIPLSQFGSAIRDYANVAPAAQSLPSIIVQNLTVKTEANAAISIEGGVENTTNLEHMFRTWLKNALDDPAIESRIKEKALNAISKAVRTG